MNTILGKKHYLIAALLFAAAPACLAQGVLAQYNMTSDNSAAFAATSEAAGITAGTLSGAYSWIWSAKTGALQVNAGSTTTTAALAQPSVVGSGNYESFTISSTTPMDLSSLTFNAGYGNFSNPAGWDLSTSVDGFASYMTVSTTGTVATPASASFDLSGSQFQGLTSITFELSGYNAAYGYEQINGLTLNGSAGSPAVPEPNTLALAGIGMMSLFGLKAWHRK
jgi:hypothetical protein